MKTRFFSIATLLSCLLPTGCNRQTAPPNDSPEPNSQRRLNTTSIPLDKRLVAGYNEFGFRLLHDLSSRDKENVVISPHSIATALAMVNNGARGQSQRELTQTLGIEALSLQEQNEANAALHDELLLGNSPTTLNVANALWAQQGTNFDPTFQDNLGRYFDAEQSELDFAQPSAVDTINNWVNAKTNGMIPKIVQELDPLTVLVLGNAVYFKGQWKKPFEKSSTQDADFHLADRQKTRVPMMLQGDKYLYFAEYGSTDTAKPNLQAVVLPYSDGRLRLCLYLPGEGKSLDDLIKSLSVEKWQRWMSQFSPQSGSVSLPRFKTRYHTGLIGPLQKLGIKQLFQQGQADLSGMSKRKDIYISQAIHQSIVEVNEEGTKAAAVTIIGETGAARPVGPPPFQFEANRPFLFALHDSKTDAILFLGAVRNPQ